MAQLNISKAKRKLDKFGILIIDEKHAKFLTISDSKITEEDLTTTLPIYEAQAGYFKGTSGGGISDELNVAREFQKRFYKEAIKRVHNDLKSGKFEKLFIMCPEEDVSLIEKLLNKDLKRTLVGIKEGNYIKININEVLEKILEAIV